MTKKETAMVMNYVRATKRTLDECYGRYSTAKEIAYNSCRRAMEMLDGYDFKIVSYNCNFFSCAFTYEKDGKERLRYYTYANTYDFEIR